MICNKMHTKSWFLGDSPYFYAMLYAKMFHGYDILKHGRGVLVPTSRLAILCGIIKKLDVRRYKSIKRYIFAF